MRLETLGYGLLYLLISLLVGMVLGKWLRSRRRESDDES